MAISVTLVAVRYEVDWSRLATLLSSFEFSAARAGYASDAVIWNNGPDMDDVDLAATVLSSGANEFHSLGINRAVQESTSDYLLIASPDMILGRDTVLRLIEPIVNGDADLVEGRQIPFDHPKDFDSATGATSWASGALCALSRELFESLDGFDEKAFPMYCNDVDLSWRLRSHGGRIMHRASAFGWHDKSLGSNGYVAQSDFESGHALLGLLFLAFKWRRMDVVENARRATRYAGDANVQRQWREFEDGVRNGVVEQLDPALCHAAEFGGLILGRNRF